MIKRIGSKWLLQSIAMYDTMKSSREFSGFFCCRCRAVAFLTRDSLDKNRQLEGSGSVS